MYHRWNRGLGNTAPDWLFSIHTDAFHITGNQHGLGVDLLYGKYDGRGDRCPNLILVINPRLRLGECDQTHRWEIQATSGN